MPDRTVMTDEDQQLKRPDDMVELKEGQEAPSLGTPKIAPGTGPKEFTLPGGYYDEETQTVHDSIVLRELTGREEDILSQKERPLSERVTEVISGCTERLGDFTDPEAIQHAVRHLPIGDRIACFIFIRRITLGDFFRLNATCPRSQCGKKNVLTLDLKTIEIHEMPDKTRRTISGTLPRSGKEVTVKVMTGVDEERISTMNVNKKNRASQAIMARLVSLDGKEPTLRDVAALPHKDRIVIRKTFEKMETAVDTDIEARCFAADCKHEFQTDLDVGQPDFFYPEVEEDELLF